MKKSAYHTPELTMAVVDCAALLTIVSGVSGQLEGVGGMIGWEDLADVPNRCNHHMVERKTR